MGLKRLAKQSLIKQLKISRLHFLFAIWWMVEYSAISHLGCSIKKGAFKNFANFTRKQLRWSLFLINFLTYKLIKHIYNFIKKRLQHMCFPVKCAKFLNAPILKNICERLLPEHGIWRGRKTVHCLLDIPLCIDSFPPINQNYVNSSYNPRQNIFMLFITIFVVLRYGVTALQVFHERFLQ